MPRLAVQLTPVGVGVTGKMFWLRPTGTDDSVAASEFKEVTLPAGTYPVHRRPSWALYNTLGKSRLYGVGAWSANILIDENFRMLRQGIPAPSVLPSISASGTGITGTAIPYIRFKDSRAQRVGPVSVAGSSLALANQGRSWSNLPTTCLDPSVDSLQGLVSMDGATPRVAWERQLGVTSVVEAVATGALGEASPDPFVEMPYGIYNTLFHDRQVIGGNEQDPTSVLLSAIGFQERYEGLKFTTNGGKVTGCFVAGDGNTLFFGSSTEIIRVTGFSEGDMTRETERPDAGLVCHAGVVLVHKRAIVPTTIGIYLYDGSWHPIMKDRSREWIREYGNFRDDYERAFGFYDPIANIYQFGPVRHSRMTDLSGLPVWTYWTLDCSGLEPESDDIFGAKWSNDARSRYDVNRGLFSLPGSSRQEAVTGSADGFLRLENEDTDAADDGDAYGKRCIIEPPPMMPDALGTPLEGWKWPRIWSYVESPSSDWTAEMRAGGEFCRKRVTPDFSDLTPATNPGNAEGVERTLHVPMGLVGDAMDYAVIADSPVGLNFRGYGGTFKAGGLGSPYVRSIDASGIGPGQMGAGNQPGGSGAPLDGCGNPEVIPPEPDLVAGTWFHSDNMSADGSRCLISDNSLPYYYTVQYRDNGDGTFTVRVKRFGREVAGEPNIIFIEHTGGDPNYYFIGVNTGTVVTHPRSYLANSANGTMVSGFNVTAATLNIQAFWADNGVIRMELSLGTVRNFYKFTGTPLVVLEGTSASAQVEYPTELYLPTLADILQSRHGGTNVWTSYDYPALSQTHPFPAFTDYGVIAGPGGNTPTRWCAPQITYGGGSFFIPINNPIGTPNVGFLELDTTLAYTKRFYGTTNVFNSAQAAWLASGSGFLLASRVGGALAPHILQHSGGASWSDLGVASPFTATKTLAGGSFFSGGSIYGLYFDNGGTNNVFLYSAASPFTTWAQVGSWSHAQASMDMGFMAWIL